MEVKEWIVTYIRNLYHQGLLVGRLPEITGVAVHGSDRIVHRE